MQERMLIRIPVFRQKRLYQRKRGPLCTSARLGGRYGVVGRWYVPHIILQTFGWLAHYIAQQHGEKLQIKLGRWSNDSTFESLQGGVLKGMTHGRRHQRNATDKSLLYSIRNCSLSEGAVSSLARNGNSACRRLNHGNSIWKGVQVGSISLRSAKGNWHNTQLTIQRMRTLLVSYPVCDIRRRYDKEQDASILFSVSPMTPF